MLAKTGHEVRYDPLIRNTLTVRHWFQHSAGTQASQCILEATRFIRFLHAFRYQLFFFNFISLQFILGIFAYLKCGVFTKACLVSSALPSLVLEGF